MHCKVLITNVVLMMQLSDEHDTSHLIQLCAYVQCYQDTVTILLGDSELSEDVAGLEALVSKSLYNGPVHKVPFLAVVLIEFFQFMYRIAGNFCSMKFLRSCENFVCGNSLLSIENWLHYRPCTKFYPRKF